MLPPDTRRLRLEDELGDKAAASIMLIGTASLPYQVVPCPAEMRGIDLLSRDDMLGDVIRKTHTIRKRANRAKTTQIPPPG